MRRNQRRSNGFTIIELVVTLGLFGVLLALGLPAFTGFIQNVQIKNAAENALNGLNIAKAEAIRRNTPVRFQFVSNMTNTCVASTASGSWVVSLDDPVTLCNIDASETTTPRIIQKYAIAEGSPKVAVASTGASSVIFSGLGRVSGVGISQINFTHATAVCEHVDAINGTARCLRVLINTGGSVKLCDPKVTATTDPRHCS